MHFFTNKAYVFFFYMYLCLQKMVSLLFEVYYSFILRRNMKNLKQFRWSLLLLVMMLVPNMAWADGYTITLLKNYDLTDDKSEYLFDGDPTTKWCCELPETGGIYLIIKISEQVKLQGYELVDAEDSNHKFYGRHWNSWEIYGANFSSDADAIFESSDWTVVDSQDDQAYTDSLQAGKKSYTVNSATAYQYYMLKVFSAGESEDALWDDESGSITEEQVQQMADMNFTLTCPHDYQNGLCTKCHEYESAVMVTAENRDTLGFTNSSFDGWYAIANAYQFAWFANKVNNDYNNYKNANAVLIADIDLTVIGNWAPIGTFQHTTYEGNFDGQNHSITGMTIEFSSSNQGLFGNVANNTIQNFTLSGSMSTLVDASWVGSVAGYCNCTTFKNIVSNVDISYATGKGGAHVGGLVGHAYSYQLTTQISHCTYNGTFDAGISSDCVGGIVGYTINKTKIEYCVNNGTVKTTATSGNIGGILGYVNQSTFPGIQNCLNTGSVSAGGAAVGAIGGTFKKAAADSNNNYYLVGSAANAIGANSSGKAMNATPLTKDQLKSGMAL